MIFVSRFWSIRLATTRRCPRLRRADDVRGGYDIISRAPGGRPRERTMMTHRLLIARMYMWACGHDQISSKSSH